MPLFSCDRAMAMSSYIDASTKQMAYTYSLTVHALSVVSLLTGDYAAVPPLALWVSRSLVPRPSSEKKRGSGR